MILTLLDEPELPAGAATVNEITERNHDCIASSSITKFFQLQSLGHARIALLFAASAAFTGCDSLPWALVLFGGQ